MTMNLLGFQQVSEEELPCVRAWPIYRAAPNLLQRRRISKVVEGTLKHHQEMTRYINSNYHGGNSSADEAADQTNPGMPVGEFESIYTTISIYAPFVYGNTSTREHLQYMLNRQYTSSNFTVEDNEDDEDVILVHYYPDEGEDIIDEDDVVEIVKNHFDSDAYLYNN